MQRKKGNILNAAAASSPVSSLSQDVCICAYLTCTATFSSKCQITYHVKPYCSAYSPLIDSSERTSLAQIRLKTLGKSRKCTSQRCVSSPYQASLEFISRAISLSFCLAHILQIELRVLNDPPPPPPTCLSTHPKDTCVLLQPGQQEIEPSVASASPRAQLTGHVWGPPAPACPT